MLVLYLGLVVLSAVSVISANFTHTATDSNGECHCVSNITIQIEAPKETQCLLAEQLILENEKLKSELQSIKESNNSEGNSNLFPVHLQVDGARWTKFWWYSSQNWPTGQTDVLGAPYGGCKSNASYCFSRLPGALAEDSTELLAIDSSGTTYRWKFNHSNPTAHAVWGAFYSHQEQRITNSMEWNPTVIKGPTPNKPQDSFMYRRQNGVLSAMLDDDNCDGYTTLSMGHGMCGNDFLSTCGPQGRFGVDLLYDSYCQTPDPKHKLALYFKDDDDCVSDPCTFGEQCVDKPNGYLCV